MFSFQYIAPLIIGLMVASFAAGWVMCADFAGARMNAQKIEAAGLLQAATDHTLMIERKQNETARKMEHEHDEAQEKIDALYDENLRLVIRAGGLRVRVSGEGGASTVSSSPASAAKPVARPTPTARLPDETTQFLLDFAKQADDAAQYAMTCKAFISQ